MWRPGWPPCLPGRQRLYQECLLCMPGKESKTSPVKLRTWNLVNLFVGRATFLAIHTSRAIVGWKGWTLSGFEG